ncbi:adenosylcobinamide amidohydrolase [Paenibacillus athensensis]|uniref:Adenosylcobinamide amidohydrolase n=1 Tax=Paenibacillus athensensis TaxID=1967502 RepID=A0A4Y8PQU2_9BACL|nr:adenosylcobinamide amidohydrolase [Paenibacillus athensensis]MCD1259142.1 adenosylcobinamide amidohydrolase [Paenibacillus athensensis]
MEPIAACVSGVVWSRVESQRGAYLLWRSAEPLRTLNTSPWGGGFGYHTCLINRQVDKSYAAEDPLAEMELFLRREELPPQDTAGLLTAARVRDAGRLALTARADDGGDMAIAAAEPAAPLLAGAGGGAAAIRERGGLTVEAWATAGLGNKARAGLTLPAAALYPGTINIIVLTNAQLTDAAMANAVITATEAKAAALQELAVRVAAHGAQPAASGLPADAALPLATGTTTDAVLIAATERGRLCSYAGTATRLGYMIGRTVYESVLEAARRWTPPDEAGAG